MGRQGTLPQIPVRWKNKLSRAGTRSGLRGQRGRWLAALLGGLIHAGVGRRRRRRPDRLGTRQAGRDADYAATVVEPAVSDAKIDTH